MRRLIGLLVLAAAIWSAWWIIGARGLESQLGRWLEARRAEGWVAEASRIEVRGFPGRFETRVSSLALADPETGLAWTAPHFDFEAPAWKPTDVTVRLPRQHLVSTPLEKIEVISERMDARLALVTGPSLAFTEATADVDTATLTSTLGWSAAIETATIRAVRDPEAANSYRLGVQVDTVDVSAPGLAKRIGLPRTLHELSLDATVGFDAPWDRRAIEDRRPQPRIIDLRRLKLRWGGIDLEAAGDLEVDEHGVPTGEIQVRAVNWRELLDLAEASGAIPPEVARTLARGLELLAAASGNPNTLELPLGFRRGFVTLGPIPIGAAPEIRIR